MQSDRDDKAVFDNFPLELWFKVFSYFDIKTRLSLRFVNRNFEQVAIDDFFWKQRYQHHFSSDLPFVGTGWYEKFRKQNEEEYIYVLKQNHSLFFLVKENDSKKLKEKTILFCALYEMDRQHETLLSWAQKMGNQDVLDHFYQIAVAAYSNNEALDTAIVDDNNRTIFYWATACRQKDEELDQLLARGSHLNEAYSYSQQQPIHIAAKKGYLGMMQYFLKKDPRLLNQMDATHRTPLFFAAANGQTAITEFLLAQDGLEHNPLPYGTTALHLAAQHGHENIVQILVEKYPSLLNQTNDHHKTPLMHAAEKGHVAVVTYLLKQDAIDLDASTNRHRLTPMNGMTALHLSIKERKFKVTEHLIEAGANLTLTTEIAKKQPIHYAAKKASKTTLRALLKRNPDLLNQADARGKTPLMIAAIEGHTKIVAYLVKQPAVNLDACTDPTFYSANANKNHRVGMTALHFAAAKNNWRAVQMLIKAGANLTLPTTFTKKQPSHFAAEAGCLKAIKALLKKDPDLLNQPDANGWAPLMFAAFRGHQAIVTYLLKQLDVKLDGAHQFTALHFAVYGTINVVKILLAKNTNLLNQVDGDGFTPLMHAARQGKSAIVKFLLQQDALTDVVANNRMTALQMAVGIGEIKIVKALLNKNPDLLNQTDDNGWTPLMRAAAMGKQRVVQHLLQQHDVTLDNMPHGFLEEEKNNETAFHLADKYGNETIINCFLKNKTMLDLLKSATFDRSKLSAATKAKLALLDYIPQRKKQPEYKRHLTFFCLPLFGLGYSRNEKLAAARELKEAVLNEKDLKDFANKREVHTGELGAIYRKIRQTM